VRGGDGDGDGGGGKALTCVCEREEESEFLVLQVSRPVCIHTRFLRLVV